MQFKDILKKLIRFVELGIINKADKNNLIFVLELLENILNQAEDLVKMQDLYDSC
jgi:inositol 1,4,5-triphosphate receptor type 1/inositol 1,4,5-triphosphate receptor type 3